MEFGFVEGGAARVAGWTAAGPPYVDGAACGSEDRVVGAYDGGGTVGGAVGRT
jgi:hypothetical protein